MFQGQYLFNGDEVLGPWMARQGDYLRVTGDLIAKKNSNLEIRVLHKNNDEEGNGTDANASIKVSISSAGARDTEEWTDLKELVRYKFTPTTSAAGDYVLFRVLEPVWFDAVDTV